MSYDTMEIIKKTVRKAHLYIFYNTHFCEVTFSEAAFTL